MITTVKKETENIIKMVKENKDPYVICPCCNRGGMQYGHNDIAAWVCIWRDCPAIYTQIPSVQEIKDLIKLKTQLKQIKEWRI